MRYNADMNEIKPDNAPRGARIKALREARGWSLPDVAEKVGISESMVKHHESGRRGITPNNAARYARLYNVSVGYILNDEDETGAASAASIPVYGEAAGGVWMEGEDRPIDDSQAFSVAPVVGFPVSAQYARKVVGNSVSRQIRDGEFAVFVHFDRYPGGVRLGDLVDVQRIRGGLREHTVKVYRGNSLVTDSDELEEQRTLPLTNGEDDTEVRIMGVAVGVFRPLRR